MRIPLPEVGRRGRLDLTFSLQDGKTILRDSYCEVPFKITRLLNSNAATPHLVLMQCTAGLFGGDDVECTIRVERGARVRITQQSATRIHPGGDTPAQQRNHVVVEEGAELQLYLEPVIPFAGSALRQITRLEVDPGGTLSFWEGFMTGRIGRGESWQFRELSSETQLRFAGTLLYLDRFRLVPSEPHASTWALGSNGYLGTGLYVGESAGPVAAKLRDALPNAGVDTLAENLVIARAVSANGPDFHRSREAFCGQLTPAVAVI